METFNAIIANAFIEKAEILEEIKYGLRCETYLLKVKNKKYIFQIYMGDTIYQAKKKYNILKKFNNKFITKAIKVKENEKYSYLITEYFEGQSLNYYRKTDTKFSLNDISSELVDILGQVHNISNENKFGWIDDKFIKYNIRFIDYINSEYNRLSVSLENIDLEIKNSILRKAKEAIKIIENKSDNIKRSCLCWYDMNPSNILISKKENIYKLEGLIDPGGARYGIAEWDIAFVKMQLCTNKEEFDNFLSKYQKTNPKIFIDMELIDALSVIVELDVISIELVNDVIILPIPYDTNFKSEIEVIHREIKEKTIMLCRGD